jgi:hypothetical protein
MRIRELLQFTAQFNVTGQPTISLPLVLDCQGLPVGVQLVGGFGRERAGAIAAQLEAIAAAVGVAAATRQRLMEASIASSAYCGTAVFADEQRRWGYVASYSEMRRDLVERRVVCSDVRERGRDVVVRHMRHARSVELKNTACQPSEPLVSINSVIVDDRLQQRGCLHPDVGIGILSEQGGLPGRAMAG